MTFDELQLHPGLLESIGYMGFTAATPVQEQAIPAVLQGRDLIACAQTGTGKTAAFMLPIIDYMLKHPEERSQALVICPTRELALQIDQQVEGICYGLDVFSIAIYGGDGGTNWDQEKAALQQGANIIVATPGKLIAHLNQGYVDFSRIKFVVLDEADRMLDIGFYDDILRIIGYTPKQRQTLMFSATMPPRIRQMAKAILNDPHEISLSISKPAEGVLQATYLVHDEQKIPLIQKLISDKPEYTSIIIFGSTRRSVKDIVRALRKARIDAEWISSDLEQPEREELIRRFRNKALRVLVATDVISRGIDIKDINLVINYTVPKDPEDYVHRVGRTARAATTGVAITLINRTEMREFSRIEQLIEREIIKMQPPEELGIGPGPTWEVKPFSGNRKGKKKKKPFKKRPDAPAAGS
jgi:superfamily II DNA/RNA helicase